MFSALDDFLVYCEIERRLAPLTCSVHHRDVRACLTFLEADGITNLAVVGGVRRGRERRWRTSGGPQSPAAPVLTLVTA